MPGPDPAHWLHRLTAEEWLAAAATELEHAEAALARRSVRPGITHADERAGRSYMEHVVALAADPAVPDEIRAAAQRLRDTPPRPPELVTLGKPDLGPAQDARAIADYAHRRLIP